MLVFVIVGVGVGDKPGVGVKLDVGVCVGVIEGVGVGDTGTPDDACGTFITEAHTCLGCFEPFGYIILLMFG